MAIDYEEIEAMNKKELIMELKRNGLAYSGNKNQLKLRLRNHLEKKTVTVNDEDDDDDDASASDSETENTFVRAEQLEKELREKAFELEALRARMHNSTRKKERQTNTVANTTRSAKRRPVCAEVNGPTASEDRHTSNDARGETCERSG